MYQRDYPVAMTYLGQKEHEDPEGKDASDRGSKLTIEEFRPVKNIVRNISGIIILAIFISTLEITRRLASLYGLFSNVCDSLATLPRRG